MTLCAVSNCRNSNRGYRSFRFPRKAKILSLWMQAMGSFGPSDCNAAEKYRICEAHFEKSDFRGYGLHEDAVPSIFKPTKRFLNFVPASKRPRFRDILIDHPYSKHPHEQPQPVLAPRVPKPAPAPTFKLMPAPEFLHVRPVPIAPIAPAPQAIPVKADAKRPQEPPSRAAKVLRRLRPKPTTPTLVGVGYKLSPAPEFLHVPSVPSVRFTTPAEEPWELTEPVLATPHFHDADGALFPPGALEYTPQLAVSSPTPSACPDTKTPAAPCRTIRPFRPWHLNRR